MDKIVHETWLTRFVSTFGDSALTQLTDTLYKSGIFQVLILTCLSITFIQFGLALHRKTISSKAIFTLFAITLIFPIQGKPCAYRLVNGFGRALAAVFELGVSKVVANGSSSSPKSNLPSGMVMEMLTQAASSKITNEEAKMYLHGFVINCLPNALTKDGEHAKFDDIFDFETSYTKDNSTGLYTVTYTERKLDEQALSNDNSFSSIIPNSNCRDGLKKMRHSLMSHLKDQPTHITDSVVESNEHGQERTSDEWLKNWKDKNKPLQKLAMNLRMGIAAEYEKSEIIKDYGYDLNSNKGNWWSGTHTDKSLVELMAGSSYTTELGFSFANVKDVISNVSGNRWAFSLGAAIKDLKERIELIPFHIASIQLLLKILCPLFVLTVLFQTFRFFFIWASAWITSLLIPVIISASRSIHNSILLSKLGIESLTQGGQGTKALAYGVDLSLAKDLMNDFTPLAYAMIEQETNIIKVISGLMLAGSWISAGGANGFVSWFSNSVQGFFTGTSLSSGTNDTARMLDRGLTAGYQTAYRAISNRSDKPSSQICKSFINSPPSSFTSLIKKGNK